MTQTNSCVVKCPDGCRLGVPVSPGPRARSHGEHAQYVFAEKKDCPRNHPCSGHSQPHPELSSPQGGKAMRLCLAGLPWGSAMPASSTHPLHRHLPALFLPSHPARMLPLFLILSPSHQFLSTCYSSIQKRLTATSSKKPYQATCLGTDRPHERMNVL